MIYHLNAPGCLNAKLHPGLHVAGGQTYFQAFTKFLAFMGYHFFLRIECSAIKNMNDHYVRDEVDDWPEYLIAGQQQRHRFLTK